MNGRVKGRLVPIAMSGSVLALAAACTSDNASTATHRAAQEVVTATVSPANGTAKARPDKGVRVTAVGGTLVQVTVRGAQHGAQHGAQRTVEGTYSPDRKTWKNTWGLKPATAYTVTAVTRNGDGRTATTTSAFTTVKPSTRIGVSDVIPQPHEKVGVGMPITVSFSEPVHNKAAVERALVVRSTNPVEGAWRWIGDQQIIFRPKTYWPANTRVSMTAHLTGVRAARGTYGTRDTTRSFRIGDSHITKVNLKTDKEKVYVNGERAKTIPVSGGMGGSDSHGNDFRTTGGVHLAMGKFPSVWMTSPNIKPGEPGYYHEIVYRDVQISNSGEYLHRSPGDFDCLGDRNCSHGCVRQTVSGAQWFYDLSMRGDVIDITGTSRDLEWDNGWGYWQMPWKKWVKGSALKHSVMTTRL